MEIKVAALYVDPKGPYPNIRGVDVWDQERDARLYNGPFTVVAHPPCGPWGQMKRFCTKQDPNLGIIAVQQVRKWGGVLEHPRYSSLWKYVGLPRPDEPPDDYGGWTLEVNQVSWGHPAMKPTWLYIVGSECVDNVLSGGDPTHAVGVGQWRGRKGQPKLKCCSKEKRIRTPVRFAEFLISIAEKCYF